MTSRNDSDSPLSMFVGVGIANYQNQDKYPTLKQAVPDVAGVSLILSQMGYQSHVFLDPELNDLDLLKELGEVLTPDKLPHYSLVILWSGHGEPGSQGGLKLIARNTGPKPQGTTPTAATLAEMAALTGANQILFIFDTCYSGEGVFPAAEVAAAVLSQYPPDDQQVWFGVITSALAFERAKDGAFGARLMKLLREGPNDAELRRRWSTNNQRLRGDDLMDALKKEWDIPSHVPDVLEKGDAGYMLPNPLYRPVPPDRMDSHLLEAALGGEPGDKRCYFAGRVAQLNKIVDRMKNGKPGAFAVAGPPGTGKSAILGRIVSLSDPEERGKLLALGALAHADPGERSVDAHLYAMRYTAESFAAEIDAQLVRHGFLPPDASGARTWDKLPGAIQQTGKCPVIVVDGLNESQSCWRIAEDVLRTLSEVSVVLVGTQDLPPADGPLPLLKTLGAKEAIDLGAPGIQQETDADVRCYIETRLAGVRAPAMDVAKIADGIVEIASRQDAGAFLVARFITAQLSEAPVDTSLPNWQGELAHSIEKTFESFIAGLPKLQRGVDQLPHAARDLMEALPWARGPGLPDDIWPIMATALSGTTYDRSDVRWLLNSAERYIVEDGQGGRAVYRFVHQWLTDYLRPGKRGEADSDDGSIKVARALVDYYERLLTAGQPPQMSAYLWRYAWLHCADAGAPGIEAFRKLVARDANAFERQLAMALSAVSKKVGGGGLWREALGAAQEAAEIYRRLADGGQNPRTELAEALVTQAWLQMMVKPEEAIQPAQQAIELFNQMDTANPAVGLPLASALTVLSLSYVQTGSLTETLKHASSAVKLLKQLSSDNPAFGPELANALTAQGVGFFQAGQPHQSADAAQEAVKLFKTAEPGNPFVRLGLAWALEVLSISHAQLGQAKEAVDAAHQAVELSSPMLAATPAAGPVLAGALSALGLGYVQNGQPKDAVDAAKKAIDLLGSMDSSNATVRIPLAAAQTVLGQASLQVGEAQQTVDAVKKAIDLLKPLDAANPVICTLLASALTFQALAYLQIGQTQQGLDAAKDASDLLESMDPGHPGVDVQLASALTVSSQCYMQSGDPERSMAAADQAVKLFRAAKAANPSVQLGLAGALTLLGTSLAELGHAKEAVCALSQAVDLFRPLQAAIPTARLQLASALAALAFATEQPDKQVEAATEAIRLFRIIDSSNAAARLSFASALAVQGQAYVQTERPKEAVGALKEATEILSSLDMANPTVCTLLAVTLNALGQAHFQTGQTQAAIDALKRALGIFQGLSRSDPKGLPEVARTLVNLDKCCRPAGRENEIDAQWEASLAAVDRPGDKAFLLIRRADGRRPQDPLAVPELLQAQAYLTLADKSGALAADLHEVCRLRRAPNPAAFDATWQSSGGGELPAWLTLDQAFLNTITEWLTKEPLEARKEFLAQHIASLNPGSDSVAFDEFALRFADLPGEAADRLAREIEFSRECLHSARELGIDKAYQPVFAGKLLLDWIALDDQAETFAMLKDRRKDLLDDEVEKVLHSLLLQFPQDLRLIAAAAILDLTRAGKEDLAFELMGNPEGAPAALLDLARSGNADVLHPLATILSLTGATDQLKALACFYKAVALAMKGGTELALQAVAEARLLNPTQENAWLALLFQFGGQRDRLIPISEALTAPQIPKAAEA